MVKHFPKQEMWELRVFVVVVGEQDEDVKDVKDEKDDEEEEAAARVEALRAAFSPTASSRQHHCEARSDMYLVCTTNDVGVKFVSC